MTRSKQTRELLDSFYDRMPSSTTMLIPDLEETTPASASLLPSIRASMPDRKAHNVRSATPAGIAFTITDLEIASELMRVALTTDDPTLAHRTYNHALRTLEETRELLLRVAPAAEHQPRLQQAMEKLTANLDAFRARS
ncbi:MAG: hypothetical protein ABW106_13480 [Steroidobacteraceae bacterium]